MAKARTAGDLIHRFSFEERQEVSRGDGVVVGEWISRFSYRAGVLHLKGGESIMTGRLAGQHSQIVFVRASAQSKAVTTEWRVRDDRSGAIFNIRDITPTDDRLWLDFLVQGGVNPG